MAIGSTANVYHRRHYELWADHEDFDYLGLSQIITPVRLFDAREHLDQGQQTFHQKNTIITVLLRSACNCAVNCLA